MNHEVTVPAHVLQDLIFNAGLYTAGTPADDVVTEQTAVLQACIDSQVGDSNTVYGREPGPAIEVDFLAIEDAPDNVVALFGARA